MLSTKRNKKGRFQQTTDKFVFSGRYFTAKPVTTVLVMWLKSDSVSAVENVSTRPSIPCEATFIGPHSTLCVFFVIVVP